MKDWRNVETSEKIKGLVENLREDETENRNLKKRKEKE